MIALFVIFNGFLLRHVGSTDYSSSFRDGTKYLFAVLNSTSCAEKLSFGPNAVDAAQNSAYLSTQLASKRHHSWLQVVFNGEEELLSIQYQFKDTKTVAERFATAVAHGESVSFTVCEKVNNACQQLTGNWWYSRNSRVTVARFDEQGVGFSLDDGLLGGASGLIDGDAVATVPVNFYGVGVTSSLAPESEQCALVYRSGRGIAYKNMRTLLYVYEPSPSQAPTQSPTEMPTTSSPSVDPTQMPTVWPTTSLPTYSPTTQVPSIAPTPSPSSLPTTAKPSVEPSIAPSVIPTASPTYSTVFFKEVEFISELKDGAYWVKVLEKRDHDMFNPGLEIINELIQTNGNGVFRYMIGGVVYNYYRRLTSQTSFNYYSNIAETWSSTDNVLNVNFEMYSDAKSLKSRVNKWKFCSYDIQGVGYPGNCGKASAVLNQWTQFHDPSLPYAYDGQEQVQIWVQVLDPQLQLTAAPSKTPTVTPSIKPTRLPTVSPTPIPTVKPTSAPSTDLGSYVCQESSAGLLDSVCDSATSSGGAQCFPGLSLVGLGFDPVTQKLKSRSIDLPINTVFHSKLNVTYLSSDWVTIREMRRLSDTLLSMTKSYRSVKENQIDMAVNYGLSRTMSQFRPSALTSVTNSIGLSSTVTLTIYEQIKAKQVSITHATAYEIAELEMKSPTEGSICQKSFYDQITRQQLVDQSGHCNEAAFDALVDNYGSFVVIGGSPGGSIRSQYSSSQCSYKSKKSFDAALKASYKSLVNFNIHSRSTKFTVMSNVVERRTQVVEGGDAKLYKTKGYKLWLNSIEQGQFPSLITYEFLSLDELMPSISTRECMRQAIERRALAASKACYPGKSSSSCTPIYISKTVDQCPKWKKVQKEMLHKNGSSLLQLEA